MGKKVLGYIKLQLPAGKATPQPPVGPALGQYGVAIPVFTKEFNERTKNDIGLIIPVVITVYADRSFTFITKTPPAPVLILKAAGIESGSAKPNKTKVAKITKEQVQQMVKVLLNLEKIPKPDDVADALAIAVCHAHSAGSLYSKLNSGGSI